jgi:hypothetical protein
VNGGLESETNSPPLTAAGGEADRRPATDEYELSNGLVVPLSGDVGDFVEGFANAVLGEVVVRARQAAGPGGGDWRALVHQVQDALAVEVAHLHATAPVELRDAVLAYLLGAAVIDTFQSLLDEAYPTWRAEVEADAADTG